MKEVWVNASNGKSWDERKKFVTTALESGASVVMVRAEEVEKVRRLGCIKVVSDSKDADLKLSKDVFYREIKSKADEQAIVNAGRGVKYVVVNALDWKVIPLENIIAALQGKCKVIVEVSGKKEANVALETLEVGSDGVMVDDLKEVKGVVSLVEEMTSEKLVLTPVKVTKVEPVGMGDRVCVDTCSMFNVGEGMLVGSQSNAMFLVHSETLETEYVSARPFRVNAGPVHAYVRMPDGKTNYLSELKAGEEVLAVSSDGKTRRLIVGRCKIERRPLVLIEAEHEGKRIRSLLQNAETILLVDRKGKPVSVSKLGAGDEVLAYLEDVGRHFGMKVKESIKEK